MTNVTETDVVNVLIKDGVSNINIKDLLDFHNFQYGDIKQREEQNEYVAKVISA